MSTELKWVYVYTVCEREYISKNPLKLSLAFMTDSEKYKSTTFIW